MPSMSSSSAPWMAAAVARPPETCTILSSRPCTTSVGILSARSFGERFGWVSTAIIWRIVPLRADARGRRSRRRGRGSRSSLVG